MRADTAPERIRGPQGGAQDAGAVVPVGDCPAALLAGAPAPLFGYCPTRANRSAFESAGPPVLRWSVPFGDGQSPPDTIAVDASGRVYALIDTNPIDSAVIEDRIAAIDPDGSVAWQLDFDGRIGGVPVLAADGTLLLVVGPASPSLVVLGRDGATVRTVPLPSGTWSNPGVGHDGTLYFVQRTGDDNGQVLALAADGSALWTSPAVGRYPHGVTMGRDGRVLLDFAHAFEPPNPPGISAVSPEGAIEWTVLFDAEDYIVNGPAVGPDGAIYAVLWTQQSTQVTLVVLEPSGAPRLRVDLPTPPWGGGTSGLSIGNDGAAFIKAGEGLFALDPSGQVRWSRDAHPNLYFGATVAKNDVLLVTLGDLRALDPLTGTELWTFEPVDPFVCMGPVTLGRNGAVYFMDCGGALHAGWP